MTFHPGPYVDPRHILSDAEERETLPDSSVRVTRTLWFIDRNGEKDCDTDIRIIPPEGEA